MKSMCTTDEVKKLLEQGKTLLIAGDENLLKKIPKGNWIGGTIPYFMTSEGGQISKEKVFVTMLPEYIEKIDIDSYDENSISKLYEDSPENGFSIMIVPATSPVHLSFAVNAPNFKDFATRPLVGWVSGVHLDDLGKISPKAFNGKTGSFTDKEALVMRLTLPKQWVCDIGIVNIFTQGSGDVIEFLEGGFSAKDILVNGKKTNLVEYLVKNKIDTKMPLVANYSGANVNVGFQNIDESTATVTFYAPVFSGVQYKLAKPVSNYISEFIKSMPEKQNILFSCNCILNFLYSELEGKKTGSITGPITFGEIAYQLLNQTLVYLTIDKI